MKAQTISNIDNAPIDESQTPEYKRKLRLLSLLRKKRELKEEFKSDFFVPNAGGQSDFFENGDKLRRYVFAGNRFGKSHAGVLEDYAWCIGERRWYKEGDPRRRKGIPSRGVKGLVIAQDWDKIDELFTSEGIGGSPKGKMMDLCPSAFISKKVKDNLGRICRLHFKYELDGRVRESILHFETVQSFLKNNLSLESSDWDFIHVDEPIPRDMWIAVSRGLVDRKGSAWFLLTPLSEMWIYDDATKQSIEQPEIAWSYVGSATENKHAEGFEMFYQSLSDEELACRRDGRPMAMGRLVIHGYREAENLLRGCPKGWTLDDTPPPEWFVGLALDTHPQTPHAALAVAISPTDVIFFDELFQKGSMQSIAEWIRSRPYYKQIGYYLIEPGAFIQDQTTGRSYADVLLDLGIPVEKASKARTECIKATNEAFYNRDRKLWIHERCVLTRREQSSWYFGKDNKPVDANDHLMECMGRLVMHDGLFYREPPNLAIKNSDKYIIRNSDAYLLGDERIGEWGDISKI